MSDLYHDHVYLAEDHEASERKTWAVIALSVATMVVEIVGGWLFGSLALIADGLHQSTHAGAFLIAALTYRFARRYARDERFCFGTGKLGDLSAFASAIVLGVVALVIGSEALARLFAPVPIHFAEAIPIAALGLLVNVASAWLLSGGGPHHHGHAHDHSHGSPAQPGGARLEIFEQNVPPRFRLHGCKADASRVRVETLRSDGARQSFAFAARGDFLESLDEVPEPHAFTASVTTDEENFSLAFAEHAHVHGAAMHDNNMRAAVAHVIADAVVSVLALVGLALAWAFGWSVMDPLAGLVGAAVIASWSATLIRNAGAVLVDMTPDRGMSAKMRAALEEDGDRLADLHLWRLGPGHLGAIACVVTARARDPAFYRAKLARFPALSHVTVEVRTEP